MKVTVIFTCFNRKEASVRCIQSLAQGNPDEDLAFLVVDDGSSDGTKEAIEDLNCHSTLLSGDGNLYWAGGMRKGIDAYLTGAEHGEYVLLVNDDVTFYDGIISKLIVQSKEMGGAVVAGATCDKNGNFTYGAMQLILPRKRDLYRQIMPTEEAKRCDTFNCNCVLLPHEVIAKAGNFDDVYTHSLADLDYGLRLKRMGVAIYSSREYIGVCEKNSIAGSWQDTALSRWERLKQKESPKGAPFREWYHFMKKNFGFWEAVKYSVSPYVKILRNR